MNNEIFLLLGTNLGDLKENLAAARRLIGQEIGDIRKSSSIYKTEPWGISRQPEFYNQVIQLSTRLEPAPLLANILQLENKMGRKRDEKWGPRVIDIDILFYGQTVMQEPGLVLPHPAIQDRKFTLVPLAEIASLFIHPILKKDVHTLLFECTDPLAVEVVK